MCGIVGYIGTKKAVPVLIKGLLSLEYRGYDSAGICVLNKNVLDVVKDKGRVKNLEDNPKLSNLVGNIGIAHTRWATHGIPSKENSHPHLDNTKQFAVVHNGIIENYTELRNLLEKNGYTFQSQTDTEVIPNLISYYYKTEKDVLKAVSLAIKDLKGSYAIEVISPLLTDAIIVARKDSPLVIGIGDNENYIASDIPAVLNYTTKFSLSLSRWCRPMLGSSRIYNTPVKEEPIWVAKRIRWLSPPESVPEERESVKYSNPTLCKNPKRLLISLRIAAAIIVSRALSSKWLTKSKACATDFSQRSAILMPPTVTARLIGERGLPWQASQGIALI